MGLLADCFRMHFLWGNNIYLVNIVSTEEAVP